ncbi:MAG: hypothetical protein P8P30_02025 [Rickettsiales bacterium]|nr:hypothetical protein [Rickettsiales bacterium]
MSIIHTQPVTQKDADYCDGTVDFFARSDWLDYAVLRPLSHVAGNWELTPDGKFYKAEEDSLADHLNILIDEIAKTHPPISYHYHENSIASQHRDTKDGSVILSKSKNIWLDPITKKPISIAQVGHYIEQSAARGVDDSELVAAASGRVARSISCDVNHFDDLDQGHLSMLAEIMSIILFMRSDEPAR